MLGNVQDFRMPFEAAITPSRPIHLSCGQLPSEKEMPTRSSLKERKYPNGWTQGAAPRVSPETRVEGDCRCRIPHTGVRLKEMQKARSRFNH
jgi:hypothetical protein